MPCLCQLCANDDISNTTSCKFYPGSYLLSRSYLLMPLSQLSSALLKALNFYVKSNRSNDVWYSSSYYWILVERNPRYWIPFLGHWDTWIYPYRHSNHSNNLLHCDITSMSLPMYLPGTQNPAPKVSLEIWYP